MASFASDLIRRARERRLRSGPSIPFDISDQARRQPREPDHSYWRKYLPTPEPAPTPVMTPLPPILDPVQINAAIREAIQAENARRGQDTSAILKEQHGAALQESLDFTKEGRQALEDERDARERQSLDELVTAFSPRSPSNIFAQTAAFKAAAGEFPMDRVEEQARRAEGMANVRRFRQVVDMMSDEERQTLGPLARSLASEGITPEDVGHVLDTYRDNPLAVYRFPAEKRRRVNRALQGARLPLDPDARPTIGPTTFIPEDEGSPETFFGPSAGIPESQRDLTRPPTSIRSAELTERRFREGIALPPDESTIRQAGQFPGGFEEDVDKPFPPLAPLAAAFRQEQELVAPLTRPVIQNALEAAQIPNAATVAKYAAEFIVPSTFVPYVGQAEKASRLGKAAIRGLEGGTIAVLQNRAGRAQRGEAPPTAADDAIIFATAFAGDAALPELVAKLMRIKAQRDSAKQIAQEIVQPEAVRGAALKPVRPKGAEILSAEEIGRIQAPPTEIPSEAIPPEAATTLPSGIVPEPVVGVGERRIVVPLGRKRPKRGDLVARSHTPKIVFGEVVARNPQGVVIRERGTGRIHRARYNMVFPVRELVESVGEETRLPGGQVVPEPPPRAPNDVLTSADLDLPPPPTRPPEDTALLPSGAEPPPPTFTLFARPLVEGGHTSGLDLWRALQRSHLTGDQANTKLRGLAENLADKNPIFRKLISSTAGPAALARKYPHIAAGVVYRLMDAVQAGERFARTAPLDAEFSTLFKVTRQQRLVVADGREVAFGDVAEAFYRGKNIYNLSEAQQEWLLSAKRLMNDVESQVIAINPDYAKYLRDPAHWPRFVRSKLTGRGSVHAPIGARQDPLKARVIEVQEEGITYGIPYEHPLQGLQLYIKGLQKLARDEVLHEVLLLDGIAYRIPPSALVPPNVQIATNAARDKVASADMTLGRLRRRAATLSVGLVKEEKGEIGTAARKLRKARAPERDKLATEIQAARAELSSAKEAAAIQDAIFSTEMNKARSRAFSGPLGEVSGISLGPGLADIVFKNVDELSLSGQEIVRSMRPILVDPSNKALELAGQIAGIPRFTLTGIIDIGQVGIQMLTFFAVHPNLWGSAIARGAQNLTNRKGFLAFVTAKGQSALAHDVGADFSEFTAAAQPGGILAGAARVFPPLQWGPKTFDGMLLASKIYWFNSLADMAKAKGLVGDALDEELFRIGRFVATAIGTTNTSGLGISAVQRQIESAVLFFSPRYTRSILGMLSYAAGNGIPAQEARRSLAGMLVVGALGMYGLNLALTRDPLEALRRLDPRAGGKFLSSPVSGMEYGIGPGYRSYVRMFAELLEPDNWESIVSGTPREKLFDNPVVRAIRSRTAPTTGALMDFISGEDFLGREVSLDEFMDHPELLWDYGQNSLLPLNLQAIIEARGSNWSKAAAGIIETVGGRSAPERLSDTLGRARDESFDSLREAGRIPDKYSDFDELQKADRTLVALVDADSRVQGTLSLVESQSERFPETNVDRFFDEQEVARVKRSEEQRADDLLLIRWQISNGREGMHPDDWGEARNDRLTAYHADVERLKNTLGVEFETDFDPGTVNFAIEEYFNVDVTQFRDPKTNEVDWDSYNLAREEVLEAISPEERDRVLTYLARFQTPIERQREIDLDRIEATGWWNIRQSAWDSIREHSPDPLPETLDDYLREQIGSFEGVVPPQLTQTYAKSSPLILYHQKVQFGLRQRHRKQYPEVILLLHKWGLDPITPSEIPFLGFAGLLSSPANPLAQ